MTTSINTVVSLLVALPAAYAFSRYSFLGDKHVFFWLLTNRMTPPAVFLLPFFQLYTTLGLMDTHIAVALAHLLFNVPLAVWILEGFMSGVPREIDETAYIDGYSSAFLHQDPGAADRQRHDLAFFCSCSPGWNCCWRALTSVNAKPIAATMTRTVSAASRLGLLAAAGVAPSSGSVGDLVRHNYIARRSAGCSPMARSNKSRSLHLSGEVVG
jgi:glycerol transport system permease protein